MLKFLNRNSCRYNGNWVGQEHEGVQRLVYKKETICHYELCVIIILSVLSRYLCKRNFSVSL